MKDLKDLLDEWSGRQVFQGKNFDDLFKVDNEVPVWYLLKTLLYPEIFPKGISPYSGDRTFLSSMMKKVLGDILPLAISLREKRKNRAFSSRKKKGDDRKKILFLSFTNHLLGPGQIFRFQNIIDEIDLHEKMTGFSSFPLFVDPLSSMSHMKLKGQHTIYDYFTEEIHKRALSEAERLYEGIRGLGKDGLRKALRNDEIEWWHRIKPAFSFVFSEGMLYVAILYYELCKEVLRSENIQASVTSGAESLFERCLSAASHQTGRPCIILQHGFGLSPSHKPGQLDYFTNYLAMGGYDKKRLEALGFPEGFILVPGPVIFDEVVAFKGRSQENKKKKVLIAGSPLPEEGLLTRKDYFSQVKNLLKHLKEIDVSAIIKLHPRERHLKDYIRIRQEIGFEDCVFFQHIQRDEYFRMVSECDSFVHFGSTAALEAMILDKPIVEMRMVEINNNILQVSDVSLKVSPDGDIGRTILDSFRDEGGYKEKRAAFLERYFDTIDGKASARAARMLINIAKGGK